MLCTPKFRVRRIGQRATGSLTPLQVAAFYQLPNVKAARQPVIGILELGGGYLNADNVTAFPYMGQPVPVITNLPIADAVNAPGGAADGEVALDIQVAGGVCQSIAGRQCKIVIAWAPNDGGTHFAAGINALVGVDAISISWGGPENAWSSMDRSTVAAAIDGADSAGVPVFVASGDGDSSDGEGGTNVDFPASYPGSIGCGGTTFGSTGETVWNDGRGDGSGGGFSVCFPRPAWQPQTAAMRGVPDVSGLADPSGPGWRIVLNEAVQAMGGTSAVAPLWAGIAAACKAAGFNGHQLPALLYGTPAAMRDILTGNNGAYTASPGWDPCTGLGSPNGPALVSLLTSGTSAAPPASPPAASPPTPPPPAVAPPTLALAQAAAVQGVEDAATAHPFLASILRLSEPSVRSRLATLWQSASPSSQGQSMTKPSPRLTLTAISGLITQLLPVLEQYLPLLLQILTAAQSTSSSSGDGAASPSCSREQRPRDMPTPDTINTDLANLQSAQATLLNDQAALSTAQTGFARAQSVVRLAHCCVNAAQTTVAALVAQTISDITAVYGPPAS